MEIKISDNVKLDEIKEAFQAQFPLLKLEFFRKGHIEGQPSTKSELIDGNPSVSEIRTSGNNGKLVVGHSITVAELEKAFGERYGLNIQVFRKSGDVWLETTTTDNLTLDEQQAIALEKTKPVESPDPGEIDYD